MVHTDSAVHLGGLLTPTRSKDKIKGDDPGGRFAGVGTAPSSFGAARPGRRLLFLMIQGRGGWPMPLNHSSCTSLNPASCPTNFYLPHDHGDAPLPGVFLSGLSVKFLCRRGGWSRCPKRLVSPPSNRSKDSMCASFFLPVMT